MRIAHEVVVEGADMLGVNPYALSEARRHDGRVACAGQ